MRIEENFKIDDEDIKHYEEYLRENLEPQYYTSDREINKYVDKFEQVYVTIMKEVEINNRDKN